MAQQKNKKTFVDKNFSLISVEPLTNNQSIAFKEFEHDQNLILAGSAGCGKTFIAVYLALKKILTDKNYRKIIIIRSAVQGREQGFLPGNINEKMEVYEVPYIQICSEMFKRDDAYSVLKHKGQIFFESTSFLRGTNFEDCIVIFDEAQNANFQELYTVITRANENCKFIICGDIKQCDLYQRKEENISGFQKFVDVIQDVGGFSIIDFTYDDIVRSQLVKDFIIAVDKYGKY